MLRDVHDAAPNRCGWNTVADRDSIHCVSPMCRKWVARPSSFGC